MHACYRPQSGHPVTINWSLNRFSLPLCFLRNCDSLYKMPEAGVMPALVSWESSWRLSVLLSCSMGLLPPASALLSSLLTALETAGMAGVLVTSGAPALEAECRSRQDLPQLDTDASKPSSMRTGVLLGRGRLLCLAGPVSHPWLFPQCALILHHAGSGTTAAALRAGVPQVTCPFIFDQFYWAGLLTSLGCSPPHLSAADLAQAGGPLGAVFRSAISLQSVAEKVASDIQKEVRYIELATTSASFWA